MTLHISQNKIYQNKLVYKNNTTINKTVIPTHVNISTTNKLFGKNPSTDIALYSYEDPYFNGVGKFTRNPSCWLNGVTNISCASPAQLGGSDFWWYRSGTLITPKHIIYANHYPMPNNSPILFVDENNNVVRRTLVGSLNEIPAQSDLRIGVLDSDVPSNIKIAKVLPKNFFSYFLADASTITEALGRYTNLKIVLYAVSFNQFREARIKLLIAITGSNLNGGQMLVTELREFSTSPSISYGVTYEVSNRLNPHPVNFENYFRTIVTGDSGKPAFLIIDNELVLLSAYWVPTGGPFVTERYDSINSFIEQLSPNQGYSLTPIDLDAVYAKYAT